jgi:DNA replication and repair protein RecF
MMYLKTLILKNFRSFKEVEVSFCPHLNFIQGDNAEGKTNLLEAIVFLSTGRSFRTAYLKELIHHDAPFFYLEAHFEKDGLTHSIKAYFDPKNRRLDINDTRFTSFNHLLGMLPTVLYAPDHVSLVTGQPAERRRFLDLHLSQLDPQYLYHISRYSGAVKQRNALLKLESEVGIEGWEEIMAESGAYVMDKRQEGIEMLHEPMRETLAQLSQERDHLEMRYHSSLDRSAPLLAQFQANRSKELSYGASLIGPHRDDLIMMLNGTSVRHFASEGQKRCLLASLRFGQWHRVRHLIGQAPILGIDDFGAHLDVPRRFVLQRQMENRGQVFLTAPHFDLSGFSDRKKLFSVKGGTVCSL